MKECFLILPNQLFNKKYISKYKDCKFYIVEESLFFGDKERIKNFSKLKLTLHRGSMKYYFDYLILNLHPFEYQSKKTTN